MTIPDSIFSSHSWLEINIFMFAKRNVKNGSLTVSLRRIADEFNITRGKARHIMDKLYAENLIPKSVVPHNFRTTSAQLPHCATTDSQTVTSTFRTTSAQSSHKVRTISERKKEFEEALRPYLGKYGRDTLNKFYQYWTQVNDGGTKMLWEKERDRKAFQIPNRLATWYKNNNGNGQSSDVGVVLHDSENKNYKDGGW